MTIKNNYTLLTYRNFADLICASSLAFAAAKRMLKKSRLCTPVLLRAATVRIVDLNCELCSSATVKAG